MKDGGHSPTNGSHNSTRNQFEASNSNSSHRKMEDMR